MIIYFTVPRSSKSVQRRNTEERCSYTTVVKVTVSHIYEFKLEKKEKMIVILFEILV